MLYVVIAIFLHHIIMYFVTVTISHIMFLYCVQRPSIQRTLQDAYKDDSKWFAPVELIRRLLIVIFIVIAPGSLVSN